MRGEHLGGHLTSRARKRREDRLEWGTDRTLGGRREQISLGLELGATGSKRWVDEVLMDLSPVKGQRTNEKTGQKRIPGVKKGLQGEDISAKTQGPEGATTDSGDSTAGSGPRAERPMCWEPPVPCNKVGGPESGEGHAG